MTYARKTLSEIKLIHGDYGNFIKGQKLDKKKEKKYKMPPYKDLAASNEIDGEPLDEKCWPGYEKKGMKTMFGKRYPNCVKKKKTRKEEYSDWRSELESIQERKIGKGKDEFFIDSTGKKKRMSQATRQDVGMAPKDPINVTPTGFRAKVDSAKNFLKQKVKLPKSASKVPGVKGAAKLLSKTPKGALVAAGLLGAYAGARAIGRKFNEIRKKRKDAAIDKQVDKYVADRKGPIRKVNYMPDNMYTVKRDKDGKVTGTGDQIRVVPGTRTIKRMPEPGDNKKKSRFSQHTRMKLGNYGSLSPMDEATMTPAQKRKDTMLKKKYEKSDDMMDSFKDQYGKKKGEEVFYAFIRKKSMEEENIQEILDKKDIPHVKKLVGKLRKGSKTHAKQADDLEKAMNEDALDENLRPLVKGFTHFARKLAKERAKNPLFFDRPDLTYVPKKSKLAQHAMYHGTSKKSADKIMKSGKFKKSVGDVLNPDGTVFDSKRAFATTNPKRAKYYANMAARRDGSKPEILAVKVRDSNIYNPASIPNEYYIKTKHMKPVGRGVKPIKIKKGQVMQNSFNPLEENSAIESELVIQDWNKDDIKFTEIETVDIIKPKPLKESMSNWREELGEDWQKVNRQDKTDGLSRKAVKAYRRENPGSKLQTAVTKDPKKLKKGSKSAKRRLSFCRRMKGMKKKLTSAKTRRDPDSRINKALRRWNC